MPRERWKDIRDRQRAAFRMEELSVPIRGPKRFEEPHRAGVDAFENPERRFHIIGAAILQKVARQHPFARFFLQMATDITRHHHERYDGQGYPDRLAGSGIPLAARIVTIADVYDGLRSRRSYKPALTHHTAVQMMTEGSKGQFDPALMQAFQGCAPHFEHVFRVMPG